MLKLSKTALAMSVVLALCVGVALGGVLFSRTPPLESSITQDPAIMQATGYPSKTIEVDRQNEVLEELLRIVLDLEDQVRQLQVAIFQNAASGSSQLSLNRAPRHRDTGSNTQMEGSLPTRRELSPEEKDRRQRELWEAMDWTDSINPDSPPSDG